MFGKKKTGNYGSKNLEEYIPMCLPRNVEDGHVDLSTFIIEDYSLLSQSYLSQKYAEWESRITPLIQMSDRYTAGKIADSFVDAEMQFVRNKHREEVTFHELSGQNISKARATRRLELKDRIPVFHEEILKRQKRIDELAGSHAKFAVRIGSRMIQLGLPVTIIALIADYFVNTEFVQSILYSNADLLRILVLCLCLLSDGTMYALGTLLSTKPVSTRMTRIFAFVFGSLFCVSVLGSLAIRVGSMPLTYGTFNAKGVFVGKDTFTIAEYALAIISSLATAVTGTLSFFFSYDREYYQEKELMNLKAEQERERKRCSQLEAELTSLENAVDPLIYDRELRIAAEDNIGSLQNGLKMLTRKLLAIHQQDASYLDSMAESAKSLLDPETDLVEETKEIRADEGQKMRKAVAFREERELREAV